jgi:hypothetical protein
VVVHLNFARVKSLWFHVTSCVKLDMHQMREYLSIE